jgi:hypothetical protein
VGRRAGGVQVGTVGQSTSTSDWVDSSGSLINRI